VEYLQKKMSENEHNFSKSKEENSLGFELIIKDLDIEKQMTEFTFKNFIS
tara:strand:- start:260 stop:409 length:150 start_codon:yes stop_codon:yes gene_type:complete